MVETPLLSVRDVVFAYPGAAAPVLDGVSLAVSPGTCLCLMGMNGCGKSTLIDCVLGEHRPLAGEVRLKGRPVGELTARQRALSCAYVPQVHERSFPYTVDRIVLMGRTAHTTGLGAPDAEDGQLAVAALARCGIEALAGRPYTSLSGGEMQMVMLARALVQQTPLILMDEPTAHLDFRNELLFLETVEALVRDEGVAVLMATHSPNQAFHLESAGVPCEVALMAGGKAVACGRPSEVLTEEALAAVLGVGACVVDVPSWHGRPPGRLIAPVVTLPLGEDDGTLKEGGEGAEGRHNREEVRRSEP